MTTIKIHVWWAGLTNLCFLTEYTVPLSRLFFSLLQTLKLLLPFGGVL